MWGYKHKITVNVTGMGTKQSMVFKEVDLFGKHAK